MLGNVCGACMAPEMLRPYENHVMLQVWPGLELFSAEQLIVVFSLTLHGLDQFERGMTSTIECKSRGGFGTGVNGTKEMRDMNRIVRIAS